MIVYSCNYLHQGYKMDKMDNIDNKTIEVVNLSDKKKRGRKKNSIIASGDQGLGQDQDPLHATENIKEKKPRKKRTKKGESSSNSIVETDVNVNVNVNVNINEDAVTPVIKKRKRRTRKDIENAQSGDTNTIVSSTPQANDNDNTNTNTNNNDSKNDSEHNNDSQTDEPKEEKVAKKRGRKPKGGKITIQPQTNSHIQNELPNIILHLKCSLSDLNKNAIDVNETFDTINNNKLCNNTNNSINSINSINNNTATIQSYNSVNAIGSEINNNMVNENSDSSISSNMTLYHRDLLKNNMKHSQHITNVHNMITKDDSHTKDSSLNETYSSAMFQVYDPCIPVDSHPPQHPQQHPQPDLYYRNSNEIINKNPASFFSTIYSPDIISYSHSHSHNHNHNHNQNHTFGGNILTSMHDDEYTNTANLNERDIWKKINQLKLSFHKSDICQNIRGAQRSACFWCTCEFDSPAIYIPKSVLKDMYNVYGCFCSPECAAAFLMNESIDTSTKFERYHLLNSLYGKIYKYEKSIKIAPNPYYLLNKFYGNLSIQEYRKLFQSDQMIYVVNKPLTHILPELYEDNNDFLLNNKIIPTNSVNLKKKVLKSNL